MSRHGVVLSKTEFYQSLIDWATNCLLETAPDDIPEFYSDEICTIEEKVSAYVRNATMYLKNTGPCKKVYQDLSKVDFDWENFECFDPDLGFWETSSGIPTLTCMAGGDWEHPIYFVMYPENATTIRAYIPDEGNSWNKKTKQAWGNEDEPEVDVDDLPDFDKNVFRDAVGKRLKLKTP